MSNQRGRFPVKKTPANWWALILSFPSLAPFATDDRQAADFDPNEFAKFVAGLTDPSAIAAANFVTGVYHAPLSDFDFLSDFFSLAGGDRNAFFRWCHSPFVVDDE